MEQKQQQLQAFSVAEQEQFQDQLEKLFAQEKNAFVQPEFKKSFNKQAIENRETLLLFLQEVCSDKYNENNNILQHSIYYTDFIIAQNNIDIQYLQMAGLTTLMIASKIETMQLHMSPTDVVQLSQMEDSGENQVGSFVEFVKDIEQQFLMQIQWRCNLATPCAFICLILNLLQQEKSQYQQYYKNTMENLTSSCLIQFEFMGYAPSSIAFGTLLFNFEKNQDVAVFDLIQSFAEGLIEQEQINSKEIQNIYEFLLQNFSQQEQLSQQEFNQQYQQVQPQQNQLEQQFELVNESLDSQKQQQQLQCFEQILYDDSTENIPEERINNNNNYTQKFIDLDGNCENQEEDDEFVCDEILEENNNNKQQQQSQKQYKQQLKEQTQYNQQQQDFDQTLLSTQSSELLQQSQQQQDTFQYQQKITAFDLDFEEDYVCKEEMSE